MKQQQRRQQQRGHQKSSSKIDSSGLSITTKKLTELYNVFVDAATADNNDRLRDLADRIRILQNHFRLLNTSLEQTNKPFEGCDGFERTFRQCDDFIQSSKPSNNKMKWKFAEDDVERLQAQIMLQVSLISTNTIVLLVETFLGNDDRELGPSQQTIQQIKHGQNVQNSDAECEQIEQLWDKISRVLHLRKRRPLGGSANTENENAPPVDVLEVEVQTDLRNLVINHESPIPEPTLNRMSRAFENLPSHEPSDLETSSSEKRPAARASRSNSFSPPARVWTLRDDSIVKGGTIYIGSGKHSSSYKLSKIEPVVVDKKRKIKCTNLDETVTIIHELPSSRKRHPITYHPNIGDSKLPNIEFPDELKFEISPRRKTSTDQAIISYKFSQPSDIKLFEEMVRKKELLHTFWFTSIKSCTGKEASCQGVKLWKDDTTSEYTLSFCRNLLPEKPHVEVSLSNLQISVLKKPTNDCEVRLEFVQDLSASSSPSLSSSPPSVYLNRKQKGSVTSIDSGPSEVARKYKEQLNDLIGSMKFLLIEFGSRREAKYFKTTLKYESMSEESTNASHNSINHTTEECSPPELGIFSWETLQPVPTQSISGVVLCSSPPNSPLLSPESNVPSVTVLKPLSNVQVNLKSSSLSYSDYEVGWICALPIEYAAAMAMLSELHGPPFGLDHTDNNAYATGRIGTHNVVIACLPAGLPGNNSAASVATRMMCSFPKIWIRLMVGIGGGVPSDARDIRLGDVVVSKPGIYSGGVVQYDMGKTVGGKFMQTGSLPPPPSLLLSAIAHLEATHNLGGNQLSRYLETFDTDDRRQKFGRPSINHDQLFEADYNHIKGQPTCMQCDKRRLKFRITRSPSPAIHYGIIASGNQVVRDAGMRDLLARQHDVLCFEMEAAGLMTMDTFPCLVIRGICDYADTHKNKEWQGYAAATAAAYAKELLISIQNSRGQRVTL